MPPAVTDISGGLRGRDKSLSQIAGYMASSIVVATHLSASACSPFANAVTKQKKATEASTTLGVLGHLAEMLFHLILRSVDD